MSEGNCWGEQEWVYDWVKRNNLDLERKVLLEVMDRMTEPRVKLDYLESSKERLRVALNYLFYDRDAMGSKIKEICSDQARVKVMEALKDEQDSCKHNSYSVRNICNLCGQQLTQEESDRCCDSC